MNNINNKFSEELLNEIKYGLSKDPRQLPSKLFYDEKGSELFNKICELDEYYLTRAELQIMEDNIADISDCAGERVLLIEFGSGSSLKTRILLDNIKNPAGYIPVDISSSHLMESVDSLKEEYKNLKIYPLPADFTKDFELPLIDNDYSKKLVYFPGSTIGNLTPVEAQDLLKKIAALAGRSGALLIGFDLQKDINIVEAAYNDALGVTAEFNLNILDRINKDLNTDFNTSLFKHCAFYNEKESRIEMHLISKTDQHVRVGQSAFLIGKNERIVTEYSYKYTLESIREISKEFFKIKSYWTDKKKFFAVVYMETYK